MRAYDSLRDLASHAPNTQTVLLGYGWDRDVWTASGSRNFFSQFVREPATSTSSSAMNRIANDRMQFEKAAYLSSLVYADLRQRARPRPLQT
jgi:hypothetical protein